MDHLIECAEDVNKRISAVLAAVLDGSNKAYRSGTVNQFIRWGLVERDMHLAVYEAFGIPLKDDGA